MSTPAKTDSGTTGSTSPSKNSPSQKNNTMNAKLTEVWTALKANKIADLKTKFESEPALLNADFGYANNVIKAASYLCSVDTIKYLLEAGCKPDARLSTDDDSHWTALHKAVCDGNSPVVKVLLENGADPNLTWQGKSCLQLAEKSKSEDTVKLVKEYLSKGEASADSVVPNTEPASENKTDDVTSVAPAEVSTESTETVTTTNTDSNVPDDAAAMETDTDTTVKLEATKEESTTAMDTTTSEEAASVPQTGDDDSADAADGPAAKKAKTEETKTEGTGETKEAEEVATTETTAAETTPTEANPEKAEPAEVETAESEATPVEPTKEIPEADEAVVDVAPMEIAADEKQTESAQEEAAATENTAEEKAAVEEPAVEEPAAASEN